MIPERLRNMLQRHEGYKRFPYVDSVGILTIGYGRNLITRGFSREEAFKLLNLEQRGLSEAEASYLLENDIKTAINDLENNVSVYHGLDEVRRAVLVDMAVNLGIGRLIGFAKMLAAIKVRDFDTAAEQMLDSVWAGQVKDRAVQLAEMMRKGEWK